MATATSTLAEWTEKPLGELLVVQNGHAFSSKKFSTTEGTPLIRIRDLNLGTGTKTNFQGEFDPQFLVSRGDLLIGMDGEFRCNIWKGPEALLNQRVCRLQNFSEKLFPKFLFYGINKYLKEIEDVTGFTTVKHLSSKSIKAIAFPVPPLSEQERIVGILDEAFEGIAAATAQAEKNLHNARELFQSVLQSTFSQKGDDWVEAELAVCRT
jgi:type I restriction enzyme S subunit